MKAKIVHERASESVGDARHGKFFDVKRLVLEEAGNLAITPHGGEVYAITDFVLRGDSRVVAEVDVPNDLIELALALVKAREELNRCRDRVVALLP